MSVLVKNWSTFQHYKTRNPPWIRLYRDLLTDLNFERLSGENVKHLIKIWLIASEDKNMKGELPDNETMAWRLGITDDELSCVYSDLEHWLDLTLAECKHDASIALASCKQSARPDQIRSDQNRSEQNQLSLISDKQKPKTKNTYSEDFEKLWKIYPVKKGKLSANKIFQKLIKTGQVDTNRLYSAIEEQKMYNWNKTEKQFIPHFSTWLNNGSWDDEIDKPKSRFDRPPPGGFING